MSDLTERLQELMKTMSWEHADLVRVSRQSSSVVSQWLGKGSKVIKTIGKLEAAIYIERASGFSALWIAKGMGPKFVDKPAAASTAVAASTRLATGEPAVPYSPDPEALLVQLGLVAGQLPDDIRDAFADVLSGWVRSGARTDRVRAMVALLTVAPGKRIKAA